MSTPNWTEAPKWAQWWAQDGNGDAYWYQEKPVVDPKVKGWRPPNLSISIAYDRTGSTPWKRNNKWRDSLTQRGT